MVPGFSNVMMERELYILRIYSMVLLFRYVLDGWPLTRAHVDLLTKFHILPVCVVELEVTDQEMLRRGDLDRKEPNRSAVCVFESLSQQLPVEKGGRELVHCTLSQ